MGNTASTPTAECSSGRLLIAADIGGTNARMQLLEMVPGSDSPSVCYESRYAPKNFSSMEMLIRQFMTDAREERSVDVCCIGLPNPVEDESRLTGPVLPNQPTTAWRTDAHETVTNLKGLVRRIVLLNDFVAIGFGLTALAESDLVTLRDVPRLKGRPMGCVGAGTGLGEVYLTWDAAAGHYTAWSSEGGMADFNAHSEEEWRLRQWLKNNLEVDTYGAGTGGVATVEAVVSGPGLLNVYRWLVSEAPEGSAFAVDLNRPSDELPGLIAEAAGSDALCLHAVEVMLTAYAAEARRKALDLLPLGGMFIAGGVAPKLIEHVKRIFPQEFLNDPVNRVMLEDIPLFVVMNEGVGLLGARVRALQCM